MRILNTQQIREVDAHTIRYEPISSIDLMERASRAFVDWFALHIDIKSKVAVVCGTGNNGGDGLAIARMLHEWDYQIKVFILQGGTSESLDFKTNLEKLPHRIEVVRVGDEKRAPSFDGCEVIVDAIFGSGLSRPPAGLYAQAIEHMNRADAMRIAVDIPSGLMADSHSSPPIVRAHYTISFQIPKLAFMLPEANAFTGEWVLVDIGLDKEFIRQTSTQYFYTKSKDIRRILRPRSKFDHKGTFGHALVIAGSLGRMGAAVLAARASIRSGVGLLSVCIPGCGYTILQAAVPEAMAIVDENANIFSSPPDLGSYSTLGIGPGLGQDKKTVKAIEKTLERFDKPVVLDADALNILASNRHLLGLVPPGSVLTPHPKEFERLTGSWKDDFEGLEMQKQLAVSLRSIVVLKRAHTSIATEKGVIYFNSTGNPGMATGGTGDVLTGVITGLLAQKYTPHEAAVAGVYLHGLAGDLAAARCGFDSLIASDVIDHLPAAFIEVWRK